MCNVDKNDFFRNRPIYVDGFNARNKCLTAIFFKQGYRYHKLRKAFYRRHQLFCCMTLWPPDYYVAVHLALCALCVMFKLAL